MVLLWIGSVCMPVTLLLPSLLMSLPLPEVCISSPNNLHTSPCSGAAHWVPSKAQTCFTQINGGDVGLLPPVLLLCPAYGSGINVSVGWCSILHTLKPIHGAEIEVSIRGNDAQNVCASAAGQGGGGSGTWTTDPMHLLPVGLQWPHCHIRVELWATHASTLVRAVRHP